MSVEYLVVEQSLNISGEVAVSGAKNAVLVAMASLLLTTGKSVFYNVPNSADVYLMIDLLRSFGAEIVFNSSENILEIDTTHVDSWEVDPDIMNKMRASILVMGPLLARFKRARVAFPGGCVLGARPIDYHLQAFRKMGALIQENNPYLDTSIDYQSTHFNFDNRIVLEYPSVGATENVMMFATLYPGRTTIINAAIEPEVIALVDLLRLMGADITYEPGSCIVIKGVKKLQPVCYEIIPDRLEAGSLLLAAAITGGSIYLPNARADHMDIFLAKLQESGHVVEYGMNRTDKFPLQGIKLVAARNPKAVTVKTGVYPSFPTDLQAPMTAMLSVSNGTSFVDETVFENRLVHARELQKMGAQITVDQNVRATIRGVDTLYGTSVIATDIRASMALVMAGLVAEGKTCISNVHHWKRGYESLELKLQSLGASVQLVREHETMSLKI